MDTDPGPRRSKINPDRIRKSASYRAALARSAKVLRKPEKLTRLVNEAVQKAAKLDRGPLIDARDNLFALFRLLKSYASGEYRQVSWSNLVLVVTAIAYFVMPVDLIPDLITGVGYLDDAAILTWTVNAIGRELDSFREWERQQSQVRVTAVEMAED